MSDFLDSEFEGLAEEIGTDAALKVFDLFKGRNIYFPKNHILPFVYTEIKKAYKNGESYFSLAKRFNYTEIHIRRIIHGEKTNNEPTLFD